MGCLTAFPERLTHASCHGRQRKRCKCVLEQVVWGCGLTCLVSWEYRLWFSHWRRTVFKNSVSVKYDCLCRFQVDFCWKIIIYFRGSLFRCFQFSVIMTYNKVHLKHGSLTNHVYSLYTIDNQHTHTHTPSFLIVGTGKSNRILLFHYFAPYGTAGISGKGIYLGVSLICLS